MNKLNSIEHFIPSLEDRCFINYSLQIYMLKTALIIFHEDLKLNQSIVDCTQDTMMTSSVITLIQPILYEQILICGEFQ